VFVNTALLARDLEEEQSRIHDEKIRHRESGETEPANTANGAWDVET
jgi:hypothetical protein